VNAFLIVDYYYLDGDERLKFSQSKHDYLIEQLYLTPNIDIQGSNYTAKLIADHPCKLMVWMTQLNYINTSGDHFNYTDSYQNKKFNEDVSSVAIGMPTGKSLIESQTILINGNPRLSYRDESYFSSVQIYQYTKIMPSTGTNIYSYSLYPFMLQPSGSCNMSQVDTIEIKLALSSIVNQNFPVIFRGYNLCYNILRIMNGLAGLVFAG
jgi:Large eukaryotic DNA virus major capsid protein.